MPTRRKKRQSKRNTEEKEFQEEVIAKGREHGWQMFSIPDSRLATAKGYVDLTMMHPEHELLMGAELKAPKGRLTKEQIVWMTILDKYYPVHLWRPENMETIQYMLKNATILDNTRYSNLMPP